MLHYLNIRPSNAWFTATLYLLTLHSTTGRLLHCRSGFPAELFEFRRNLLQLFLKARYFFCSCHFFTPFFLFFVMILGKFIEYRLYFAASDTGKDAK